ETYAQMHRHGVTIGVFPPVYLQQLAEHAERDGNPPPVRVYCFGGDALSASLIYATSLFERSTVERLAAHWRNLLEAICREPARRVGELPLLDRSERDLLLARWDQTGEDYPSRPFVHQL
ncbi:condensation domain-containing protein, partial [Pseudomonas aeruginosa]